MVVCKLGKEQIYEDEFQYIFFIFSLWFITLAKDSSYAGSVLGSSVTV